MYACNPQFEVSDDQDSVQMLQRSSQVGEFYRMAPPAVFDEKKLLPSSYMGMCTHCARTLIYTYAHTHSLHATAMMVKTQNRKSGYKVVSRDCKGFAAVNLLVQRAIGKVLTKAKARDRAKAYHRENRSSVLEKNHIRYADNSESRKKDMREYHQRNREEHNKRMSEYQKQNRKSINNRKRGDVAERLRCRLRDFLKRSGSKKNEHTAELIGCTFDQLKVHLQSQLEDGASLDDVHIDHIFPLASYDMRDTQNHRKAMHYSNLQPLSPFLNQSKSNRLPLKHMASKVERWAWPDSISMEDLPTSY